MRGKRNEPSLVRFVAERLAVVRGLEPEAMIAATGANAARLFGPRLAAVR
jgi:TatD DNase family protein